jgi:FHA domain
MICQQDSPQLVIVAPGASDRRVQLRRDYMVVGREPTCDIRLDGPDVSRTHAAVRRRGDAVYVQDLGSSCGTFVGGTAVTTPRELSPGDVVSFASVLARFESASAAEQTLGDLDLARPEQVVYRAPSGTRTRARWLSCTGLLVLAEGFAVAAATKLTLGGAARAGLAQYRLGPTLAGVPAGLLGWALAAVGFLLLVIGIGLHIAAAREH